MQLHDGDLLLRPFGEQDRTRLPQLADNPNVSRFMALRFPHPYRQEDADSWLRLTAEETRICNFAVAWRGELVGGIGLKPMDDLHSGTSEIGYWLGEPYWGKGLITRAVKTLLPYAFDELLFIRLQALIFVENLASQKVLEKNGFAREGVLRKHLRKNGVISDAVLYAKLRNE